MSAASAIPWYRQAGSAIASHAILKAVGTTAFVSLFFAAYFYVLRRPAFPPTVLPVTALDRWIGFQPLALPVYLSLWVYVCLVPALLSSRDALYRHALSMALMCAVGLSIFYLWPTAIPAPDIDWHRYPEFAFLKNIDATGNACPSLHVATALLSAVWFDRVLRGFGAPRWLVALTWAWCAAIVYSTIAIRQHVALDAVAGLVLGGVAAWLSVRVQAANIGGSSPE